MKIHPYTLLYIKTHGKLPPGFDISKYLYPSLIKEYLKRHA